MLRRRAVRAAAAAEGDPAERERKEALLATVKEALDAHAHRLNDDARQLRALRASVAVAPESQAAAAASGGRSRAAGGAAGGTQRSARGDSQQFALERLVRRKLRLVALLHAVPACSRPVRLGAATSLAPR